VASLTQIDTACALLEVGGARLLTDPVFDPPGARYHFGWGALSRKSSTPALSPEQVGKVDAILLSHDQHGDNLDRAGRKLAEAAPLLISTTACRLKNATGLKLWETIKIAREGSTPLTVQATPAQHRPRWIPEVISGKVIGFLIESEALRGPLWISGDTVLFDGVREVARRAKIDTAVLHVGAVRFPWLTGPARYTFNAAEAVEVARFTQARKVIALHTSGWTHFREGQDELRSAFSKAGLSDRLTIPVPGRELDLSNF
jgi:L-ascorbate metabolism protein UlaG (beta-lactamase superfamily)